MAYFFFFFFGGGGGGGGCFLGLGSILLRYCFLSQSCEAFRELRGAPIIFFVVSRLYYFAIQYYGECWGAPVGAQYHKHGPANNCWSGVGGPFSNYVYKL